jgi:hypothetical protein
MGDELQKPGDGQPSWGRVALTALKWFGVALGLMILMIIVGGVLLVGFLIYACGHH